MFLFQKNEGKKINPQKFTPKHENGLANNIKNKKKIKKKDSSQTHRAS